MDEKIKQRMSLIESKIAIIESLVNALISCICGIDTLEEKDACNIAFLLENRVKDLKIKHTKLINDLKF
ncbi:hypothetical protein IJ818_01190 [bacterium]|nr:hypothetical protein [bacterium]